VRWVRILGALVLVGGAAFGGWQLIEHLRTAEDTPAPAPGALSAPPPVAAPQPPPAPVEAAPALVQLEINVTGSKDAVIVVDGDERGRGTAVKVDVKPGKHAIEVQPPKAAPISRDVEVVAGQENVVEIDVPAPRPAIKPPPPVVRPPLRPKPPLPPPIKKPPDENDLLKPKGHS